MMNPEIMLFGKKIILPESGQVMTGGEYSGESCVESSNGSGGVDRCLEGDREKVYVEGKHKLELADEDQEELCETAEQDEEDRNPIATDESHNNTNHPSSATNDNEYDDYDNTSKTENEQSDSSQPKTTLKKPDKILPCPRCNSTDTKFCYFNNYNVNQPRHFCKGCQRYWTDGGTMRNVPVGAGRRKNKNYYARHLTISEPSHHHIKLNKSTVLSFGEDAVDDCNKNPNGFLSPLVVPFTYPAFYTMGPYYYAQPAIWNQNVSPAANQSPLGKHSRDGESSVVVPKTLRIGDPEEAARSSIWSTLGIENRGGLLKALQPKGCEKNSTVNASPLMLANPAALSRSISFQERI